MSSSPSDSHSDSPTGGNSGGGSSGENSCGGSSIYLVVTSSNNACLCALNGVLPSLVKTISQRSRQRYWPLSRRLDRSDRVIQNESRDSKAVMCVCLQRRHVRHNASYVPNAKMPVCPLCSRGLYP